jgi:O-acetyl-ADP-ribose deacetylase (regulator of RNase III)
MSKEETMVERVRLIAARHADTFASIHAAGPNLMSEWSDFSPLEQAKATALVDAVIDTLMELTPEMVTEGAFPYQRYRHGATMNSRTAVAEIYRAMLSKAKEGTGE